MERDSYTISEVAHGPQTLIKAADSVTDKSFGLICTEEGNLYEGNDNRLAINGSTILTEIIHYVGRFCENHASDIMYEFMKLAPFLRGETNWTDDRWVIGLGIRENGVDGNEFIISTLKHTIHPPYGYVDTDRYRKLLVIDIKDELMQPGQVHRTVSLKDVRSGITSLDENDI